MTTPKRKAIAIAMTIVILLKIESTLETKLNEFDVCTLTKLPQGQDRLRSLAPDLVCRKRVFFFKRSRFEPSFSNQGTESFKIS